MADENRDAAWPDRLLVLPATKGPTDRIQPWLELKLGGIEGLRNTAWVCQIEARNNFAGSKTETCKTVRNWAGGSLKTQR